MKPIPIVFHIGPLQIHTYGIGLAITFWFGYRYFAKRLRDHGYPDAWLGRAFVWIVIMSIVGARAVSVIANLRGPQGYIAQPRRHLRHLARRACRATEDCSAACPPGLICGRRWCPQLRLERGARPRRPGPGHRLGGGPAARPAVRVPGRRLPDPRLVRHGLRRPGRANGCRCRSSRRSRTRSSTSSRLWVERRIARRGGPIGVVATTVVTLYGAFRFNDEYVLLPHNTGGDVAVLVASLAFVGVGAALAGWLLWRDRGRSHEGVTDPWHAPAVAGIAPSLDADGAGGEQDEGEAVVATPEADMGGVKSTSGTELGDHEPEATRRLRTVPGHANRRERT